MGNRAVIVFDEFNPESEAAAIYVHWNGGRDSIEGYLKATRILMGDRLGDEAYARARLFQVIGIFMGGCLSFGMGTTRSLTGQGDNGVFIVNSKTMTIKGRAEWEPECEEQEEHDVNKFTNEIIKLINVMYTVHNEESGKYSQLDMLPTAETFDGGEEA